MLSPLKYSPACLPRSTIPTMALSCLLAATPARGEIAEQYRQEPILPIPETIKVDTEKANLGELLFYDTRLSHDRQVACASCHQLDAGGDDNVALGVSTTSGQHIINTPSIFNARYNFRQNWDGSVKTLVQQIDKAVSNHHVFNNSWEDIISTLSKDHELTSSFQTVYQQEITRENVIDAIVEFEKTLVTPNSRFDRYLRHEEDALTDEEIRGYLTFKELGCISCHQGINIGGNLYQKFGVFYNYIAERGDIKPADYGRMNDTNRQMDAFVFKVPTLRNISVTAPYLHDGSADTIEEAISIMGKTQLGRTLNEDEIHLIKAFLNTLTGEYKNRPLEDPS